MKRRIRTTTIGIVLALMTSAAYAETARERLTEAESAYLEADFTGALADVSELLREEALHGDSRRDGWVLRARCELALGHRASSGDSFCEALRIDRSWRPDTALFTRDEIESFERTRSSCPPASEKAYLPPPVSTGTPWYQKKTVLGLVGAAVVTAGVFAFTGGDDGGEAELAPFPDAPVR